MRPFARASFAATCCVLVITSACSDSTSPTDSQQASQLAAHFDSLYVAAADLADSSANYANRALSVTYLELATALGSNVSTVTVTTANGTESWKGLELEDVETSGDGNDEYLLIAYRESAAHSMLLAYFDASGNFLDGGIFANDTLDIADSAGTGSTTRTAVGDSCTTPAASLANPLVSTIDSAYTCVKATFNTSLTLTMPSVPNVDPALTHLSFSGTTFNGARLVSKGIGTASTRRARALFQRRRRSHRL